MLLSNQGHELYLEVHGREADQELVLLHHGIGSVNAWEGQISPWVAAGFRVVVYDRWGYGRSGARPDFSPWENFMKGITRSCQMKKNMS